MCAGGQSAAAPVPAAQALHRIQGCSPVLPHLKVGGHQPLPERAVQRLLNRGVTPSVLLRWCCLCEGRVPFGQQQQQQQCEPECAVSTALLPGHTWPCSQVARHFRFYQRMCAAQGFDERTNCLIRSFVDTPRWVAQTPHKCVWRERVYSSHESSRWAGVNYNQFAAVAGMPGQGCSTAVLCTSLHQRGARRLSHHGQWDASGCIGS